MEWSMTSNKTDEVYVSPFTRPGVPTLGRVVLYRHADGNVWPAIVCALRAVSEKFGDQFPPETLVKAMELYERDIAALRVEVQLTVMRPGKIEWTWCVEGTNERCWSWPTKREEGIA